MMKCGSSKKQTIAPGLQFHSLLWTCCLSLTLCVCVWQRESSQTATVPHVRDTHWVTTQPKILPSYCLSLGSAGLSFLLWGERERERKKTLLLSRQSGNRLSFLASPLLTGKSVSCRRWKDCGLFSGGEQNHFSHSPPRSRRSLQSHTWVAFSVTFLC